MRLRRAFSVLLSWEERCAVSLAATPSNASTSRSTSSEFHIQKQHQQRTEKLTLHVASLFRSFSLLSVSLSPAPVEDVSSERVSTVQIYLERTRSLAEVGSASLVSSISSPPPCFEFPSRSSSPLKDLISPIPHPFLILSLSLLRLLLPWMVSL